MTQFVFQEDPRPREVVGGQKRGQAGGQETDWGPWGERRKLEAGQRRWARKKSRGAPDGE